MNIKNNKVATFLPLIYVFAFLFFFTDISFLGFPLWQILAHIGLIGLVFISFKSCLIYRKKIKTTSWHFQLFVVLFFILALEEIITEYTGTNFLSNYLQGILALDLYPFIFSFLIGQKLAKNLYSKAELEMKVNKIELEQSKLKIDTLENEVLKKKLDFKRKDLADFGIKIEKDKIILEQVLDKLFQYKKDNDITSNDFETVILFVKSQLRIGNMQEVFHKKIETVNHEFLNKVKSQFPNLTESELNLISLLKIKLSTKEIASIKNISPDSVKVLRYRLRKKLSLEKGENLTKFLDKLE